MKRFLIYLILFSVILCGCTYQLPFRQSTDNIVKIQLVDNCANGDAILYTLEGAEIAQFMGNLQKINCCKNMHPIDDYGVLEIRIIYSNGDVDIVGSRANGYVEAGVHYISGWYYYKEESLRNLFSFYIS